MPRMTQSPPSLPYADRRTRRPLHIGGPPSWGPFTLAVIGTAVGAIMLILIRSGLVPMTMTTVPFVMIPGMIAAFTLAATSMGWMFLLFGRFGRRTRWLWPAGILIGVILLELFAMTYLAGLADAAGNGG